ncbi:MAG: hypothetical protein CMM50_09775 [Rhodospirillaceae bacterium]|nr:hypothetical protein [Rhodospirillaceae bacterium]
MASRRLAKPNGRKWLRSPPQVIALGYVIVGALWIIGSDLALDIMVGAAPGASLYQTWKGWFYVAVTGALLYLALAAVWNRVATTQSTLDMALEAAGGGVWRVDIATQRVFTSPHLKKRLGRESELDHLSGEEWRALIHPDDIAMVDAAAARTIEDPGHEFFVHYRLKHADGTWRWFQSRGHVLCNRRGEAVQLTGITLDVTHLVETEEAAHQQATYDPMTGLLYRDAFTRTVASRLTSKAEAITPLVRLSLRRFSDINNAYGFKVGDDVLRRLARRLLEAGGAGTTVGRIAGDEFALVYPDCGSTGAAETMIDRLLDGTTGSIGVEGYDIRLAPAIGVAFHPSDGGTAETLMSAAGFALQEARETRDRPVCYYAKNLDDAYRKRIERSSALRSAAGRREFVLHYQPVIALAEERTAGFEALVRWNHPRDGLLPPNEFIPFAEMLGLIHEIGAYVLEEGCGECARWQQDEQDFFLAVNLSPRQLVRPELAPEIARILKETGWPADRLELEITETAITEDFIAAAERLGRLRDLGVKIAIDDFGTGYSTFTSLLRLPITKIKIDRSFVTRYGADDEVTLIVDTVVQMADRLGMDTTAEGVETEEQAQRLKDAGCESVQGYLFSPPVPSSEAKPLLTRTWRNRR